MKGGSITEILLDTIFTMAFCRAFDIPLKQFIGGSSSPAHSIPSSSPTHTARSNAVVGSQEGSETEGHSKAAVPVFEHSLCDDHTTVASIIDTFASVYNAAYR